MGNTDDEKYRAESPGIFHKLRQLKNAVLSEFQKLSPFNQPRQTDATVCKNLVAASEKNVEKGLQSTGEEAVGNEAICEICTDPLTGAAVFSCNTCFNLVCSFCLVRVRKCPFCRSPGMFADRNRALERFLTTLNLPCKNQRYGCTEYVDQKRRERHEKSCQFAPFRCLHFPVCQWAGNLDQLKQHLQNDHFTKLIQSDHAQVKIGCVWSKLNSAHYRRKGYFIMYCHGLVFICTLTLFRGNITVSFVQMKTFHQKVDGPHFGVGIEVNSLYRTVRGIIPLPEANQVQCISLSPKFLLLPDDSVNDKIVITIDIKNLDSILSE